MSRGLILAGLGQGISNATSQIGNMMIRQNEEDRRDAREEARDMRRIQAAEDREEQLKQRMISEVAAAREGGAQMGRERMAGQVLAASGSQMAGESPVMDQAEFANILRDNPEYEQIYRQAGLVTDAMDPRMQRVTDQYDAALGAGASSATLQALEKSKKTMLDLIKEENRSELAEAKEERRSQEFRALLPVRQQQADANTARAERLPASLDPDKPLTTQDMQRRVDATANELALALGTATNNINNRIVRLRQAADRGDANAQTQLREVEPLIQAYISANRELANFGRTETDDSGDNTRTQSGPGNLPKPITEADYDQLPPGTRFMAPDGTIRTKS